MRMSDKVIEFLKENPEERFKAREIAEWIWEAYPEDCRAKMERSKATVQPVKDKNGLIQQLVAEIGSHHKQIVKKEPRIQTTEGRPRRYYFIEKTGGEDKNEVFLPSGNHHALTRQKKFLPQTFETAPPIQKIAEKDLYPVLSQYLASEFAVHSKRIDERKSKNTRGSKGNHWRFPDLVGLEDLSSGWSDNIKHCAQQFGDQKAKLWSFEVKLTLNMSNARESFFQAASNSSWANYGYLVVLEISGKDTMRELAALCNLHGIGLMKLDHETPADSELMIQAKEAVVDWHSADILADQNTDFAGFVELVTDFHKTGKIHPLQWDAVLEEDDA